MIAIADEILDYENIPWKKYASKDSGILKYSAGSDFIWLEFKLDKVYYTPMHQRAKTLSIG
jgi:hypothetical protein